ncbi:hypothetical protein TWF506_011353 [Arthrobotrys conoides]|uniref:Uncharacterized protein n=1 Tax=Arthrobotrys conoides TaxID=74498 RepID=A0AAN8PAX6_9PEZI
MAETKRGTGLWANLPASKDPASPHYLYHPEHERLSSIVPSEITSPSIIPALPSFIAYWTGMHGIYDVPGRDSVSVLAMRRRAETLPRPFTQTEHAILSRYSKNLQNGSEYIGLLGLVGGAYQATRTEFWPMEESVRTMLGTIDTKESAPPSGFVYPNGWGQKEGNGAAGASSSSSTVDPKTGSAPTTATIGSPTNIPPRTGHFRVRGPPMPRIDITKVSAEYLSGPRVAPTPPLMNYSLVSAWYRWFYMLQMPPQGVVNFTTWQIKRLAKVPPERRDNNYRRVYEMTEWCIFRSRELALLRDIARRKMKINMDKRRARVNEYTNPMAQDEILSLAKEFEEFDKKMAGAREAWVKRTGAIAQEIEAAVVARRALEETPTNWFGIKKEFKKVIEDVKEEEEADKKKRVEAGRAAGSQGNGEVPRKAVTIRVDAFKTVKEALRVGTWAFFGKYVVGTLGLIWLTSRTRGKEMADERLQEFNYDRMEYAKLKIKEAAAKRRLPVPPPSQPPPQQHGDPTHGDEGGSGARRPERFESVDNQSLGGIQSESIDWGDFVKDDTPAVARQQSNNSVLPPLRPGESAWDRARRAREGPQGPAMEEDRWAPQEQQDKAPKTDDMANMSRWERIRQQASEGYGGERRVPGENRDGGDSSGSFGGFGGRQQGQDRQKTKEELQREFDAQVEKDRRGEEGSWK